MYVSEGAQTVSAWRRGRRKSRNVAEGRLVLYRKLGQRVSCLLCHNKLCSSACLWTNGYMVMRAAVCVQLEAVF